MKVTNATTSLPIKDYSLGLSSSHAKRRRIERREPREVLARH
jgi:hypothetical protein